MSSSCWPVLLFLLGLFVALVVSKGSSCGVNCPSTTCPNCLCGTSMQTLNLTQSCSGHGWSVKCCECIAKKESSGNLNLLYYNASTNTYFAGLFQISSGLWNSCNNGAVPCDQSANFRCANSMFKTGGNTWKAWKSSCGACNCCTSG